MIINKIENYLSQYTFEPKTNVHFGTNVFIIKDQDRVLIIDTGYPEQGKLLNDEIIKKKMRLNTIIISHFHDDHMGGLSALESPCIIGHHDFQRTLDKWTPMQEQKQYIPTRIISSKTQISFGKHSIVLIPLTGHSESDLLILIDNTFLHIGDLILQDSHGTPILPAVERELITDHIQALVELKNYIEYPFLLSHGPMIKDPVEKMQEIDDRLRYLETLKKSKTAISYDKATKSCKKIYLHSEWHDGYYE